MFHSKRRPSVLPSTKLRLEALEDRCLMNAGAVATVLQTNLVSDLPGVAQFQDPNLVNPWGISEGGAGPFWVSDNNSWVSSLYNTSGTPQALVVNIPSPNSPTFGTPTGTVFNIDLAHSAFTISDGTHSAPAVFLFATEDGTIAAWSPTVDPTGKFDGPNGVSTHAVLAVDNSTKPTAANGAVYKGLAVATDSNGTTLLYAANFRAGTIDVFGSNLKPVTTLPPGAFTDPKLPKGYAPFDVQELNGKIYVTYAKQNSAKHDDVAGQGHGFVDVYKLDGSGEQRLVSGGALNSPWGLAIAPSTFGAVAGALLVGNFRDGHIHAYDPGNGKPMGQLSDPDGEPIQIDGLWALKVGNGGSGGDAHTVYFTAGLDHETHGLFGSLAAAAPGSPEGPAEQQVVVAALDVFQLNLNTLQSDLASGAAASVIKQDIRNVDASLHDLEQAESAFLKDARDDAHAGHGASPKATRHARDSIFSGMADLDRDPHMG